jgi:uncharacterized protein
MFMIDRTLEHILKEKLFRGKAIVIMGARQVGKTTLLKKIASDYPEKVLFLNCDEPDIRKMLAGTTSTRLASLVGNAKLVVVDEAQRVKNIGLTLKLITDELPGVQLIVSGSSSLELANEIHEPLTGRKFGYELYPLSFGELANHHGLLQEKRLLEHRLVYGSYPDVINHPGDEKEILANLTDTYLFKDLFEFQDIRKPDVLQLLLEALALQDASEVSYHELAQTVQSDPETVKRYISLLEKTWVVFRLRSFSRNVRNELKKSRKIYFYDNGVRNAVIRNFNSPRLRQDTGALWENYLVSERKKRNMAAGTYATAWFWRTKQQQEIDYLEEKDGHIRAFEFKWNPSARAKWPKTFVKNYPDHSFHLVHPENVDEFL